MLVGKKWKGGYRVVASRKTRNLRTILVNILVPQLSLLLRQGAEHARKQIRVAVRSRVARGLVGGVAVIVLVIVVGEGSGAGGVVASVGLCFSTHEVVS